MKRQLRKNRCLICSAVFLVSTLGCEVTPEKIETWKGTQNGPAKIAASVVKTNLEMTIRAKAAVALVQTNRWQMLDKAFQMMSEADRASMATTMLPAIKTMLGDITRPGTPTNSQVQAKDALVFLLPHAKGDTQAEIQKHLIDWTTGDFNARFLAGSHSIKKIVQNIGGPATMALANMLREDLLVLKPVCELIKEVNHPESMALASQKMSEALQRTGAKSTELFFDAASIIGGEPLQKQLLGMAAQPDLPADVQRWALRAYAMIPNPADIDEIFSIAMNEKNDRFHREEAYYAIMEMKRVEDLPRVMETFKSSDPFWRGVGFKVALSIGGKDKLRDILRAMAKANTKWTWEDLEEFVIQRIALQKIEYLNPLLDTLRDALSDDSAFVRAVAVVVLGRKGQKDDIQKLKPLESDRGKIKGFPDKTVGASAKRAIRELENKP